MAHGDLALAGAGHGVRGLHLAVAATGRRPVRASACRCSVRVRECGVQEVPKELPQTAEEWMTAANEAFEDDLPAPFEARLKRWTAGHSVPGFSSSPFPKTGIGGLGGA